MTYYRIYGFGRDHHIQAFTEVHCETDAEALAEAQTLISRFTRVEVWDRGRMVHRLDGQTGPVAITPERSPSVFKFVDALRRTRNVA